MPYCNVPIVDSENAFHPSKTISTDMINMSLAVSQTNRDCKFVSSPSACMIKISNGLK